LKRQNKISSFGLLLLLSLGLIGFTIIKKTENNQILAYTVDPQKQDIELYWKNDNGQVLKSIQNLKQYVEGKKLTLSFAMNGGMYMEDNSPLGLFIREQKVVTRINKRSGKGNFYLNPNGVFYITTEKKAEICKTSSFKNSGNIKYATQSGPMLIVDGQINSVFTDGSTNLNIRNGVGILPDNKVVFAISKTEINFYDFAKYFQNLGCKNALYLDGFVSRAYLPEKKWNQLDGDFGVIIAVTKKDKK
jgi:uncharacterized protein YigE (DUF2233 family)